MITCFFGDDSFEIAQRVKKIVQQFEGEPERYDGHDVTTQQLPELVFGQTLFQPQRLVVIKELSQNKPVWTLLDEYIDKAQESIQLVLIENTLDKRTKTFKHLQKSATIEAFAAWTERDSSAATAWVVEEAERLSVACSPPAARLLVDRAGVDKWRLHQEISKLSVYDEITKELIEAAVSRNAQANVFAISDYLFTGQTKRLAGLLEQLEQIEDPYKIVGLIVSQVLIVTALVEGAAAPDIAAKELKAHPYVVKKLQRVANGLSRQRVEKTVERLAWADRAMKSTARDPWIPLKAALLEAAKGL